MSHLPVNLTTIKSTENIIIGKCHYRQKENNDSHIVLVGVLILGK